MGRKKGKGKRMKRLKGDDLLNDVNDEGPKMTAQELVMEEAMTNPLILKEVLSSLPTKDLCSCSLVSKLWNYHAREVLRDVKHCVACIEEENSCSDLQKFNSVIKNTKEMPFYGISISCPWSYYSHRCVPYSDLSEFTDAILKKLRVKFLAIDCERLLHCASVYSIRTIFNETRNTLESLSVEKLPLFMSSLSEFLEVKKLDPLFTLRDLDFPCDFDEDGVPESVVEELVRASPNLRRLTGNVNPKCLDFILPLKKVAAVKDFILEATEDKLGILMKFAMEGPRLEKLRFSSSSDDDGDSVVRWNEYSVTKLAQVLGLILESSKDTLIDFAVDQLDLILLARWGMPVLHKLKRLTLTFSESVDRREGYSTLRRINFEHYFPKLEHVLVRFSVLRNEDFYISTEFRQSQLEFTCNSVTELVFCPILKNVSVSQVSRFKELFPQVKHFCIHRCDKLGTFLGALWTSWTKLESITFLTVEDRAAKHNLDSVFCGIPKREVSLLQNFEGDLGQYNLVPTRPSVRNLPKLKSIRLEIRHFGDCRSNSRPDTVFLSQVTTRCVLAKIPGFTMEIDREECKTPGNNCCFSLNHLLPYVKFTASEDWGTY